MTFVSTRRCWTCVIMASDHGQHPHASCVTSCRPYPSASTVHMRCISSAPDRHYEASGGAGPLPSAYGQPGSTGRVSWESIACPDRGDPLPLGNEDLVVASQPRAV